MLIAQILPNNGQLHSANNNTSANDITSKPLAFWEFPNAIAIYLMTGAFFSILVFSLVASSWSIGSGQITLISVIAALLLFRYYSTVKLAGILELSNVQIAADNATKNAAMVTEKVEKEIKPKVEKLITATKKHNEAGKELRTRTSTIVELKPYSDQLEPHWANVQNIATELQASFNELEQAKSDLMTSKAALDKRREIIAKKLNRF